MNHHPVPPANRGNARKMRKALTDAELKLWNAVRAHRLMGLQFRRQMPIAGYIVDFACPTKKIIVELDGSQHASGEGLKADATRDAKLKSLRWTILRFWNDDVIRDIDAVCDHIVIAAGLMAEDAARQVARFIGNPTRPLRGHPPLKGEGAHRARHQEEVS